VGDKRNKDPDTDRSGGGGERDSHHAQDAQGKGERTGR
jgi:hypothetical protein